MKKKSYIILKVEKLNELKRHWGTNSQTIPTKRKKIEPKIVVIWHDKIASFSFKIKLTNMGKFPI